MNNHPEDIGQPITVKMNQIFMVKTATDILLLK